MRRQQRRQVASTCNVDHELQLLISAMRLARMPRVRRGRRKRLASAAWTTQEQDIRDQEIPRRCSSCGGVLQQGYRAWHQVDGSRIIRQSASDVGPDLAAIRHPTEIRRLQIYGDRTSTMVIQRPYAQDRQQPLDHRACDASVGPPRTRKSQISTKTQLRPAHLVLAESKLCG